MKKFILMLVLTPVSFFQTALGSVFFMGVASLRSGSTIVPIGDDGLIVMLASGAFLIGLNLIAVPLRFGEHDKFLHVIEFIVSPLRFPLQIITDILTLLSYVKNITIVTKVQPRFSQYGLLGTLSIYFLCYYPSGKALPTAPSNNYSRSNVEYTQNDTRKSGVLNYNKFQSVIKSSIPSSFSSCWNQFHCYNSRSSARRSGGFVIENIDLQTSFGDHRITVYVYFTCNDARNINTYASDLTQEIVGCVSSAVEQYRDEFTGHDKRFDINVKMTTEVC